MCRAWLPLTQVTHGRAAMMGFSGIIQSNCSPLRVCRAAAEDARHLCMHHLGEAPEIKLHGDEDMMIDAIDILSFF